MFRTTHTLGCILVLSMVAVLMTPGLSGAQRGGRGGVRTRWRENGREVTQTKRVEVTPGAHVNVSFPGQAVNKV